MTWNKEETLAVDKLSYFLHFLTGEKKSDIAAYLGTAAEGLIASHLQFVGKINLDFSFG